MLRHLILLSLVALTVIVASASGNRSPAAMANPGAVTLREPAYGLPHIYADTDLELVREYGREIAKDRLGQLVLISRVARGTLFQAFGSFEPATLGDDIVARQDGYTSSELNNMYDKLPTDIQALLLEYARGVNDTIEAVYTGAEPQPLAVFLLRALGLSDDLFGNATNISDQIDPFYKAPGGADPLRPNAGFQFTPELVMAISALQVRSFGSENFGEVSRLSELNGLLAKFPITGDEIWDDLNFLNDPLAPVSVPDATTPGFGGPLARRAAPAQALPALVDRLPNYRYGAAQKAAEELDAHREAFARRLGAWPALGSYSWMIDGERSSTGNPWIGGFPQTGIQTPSIMHFVELRSAEGTDHRIQTRGMAFMGAPAVLIGETDSVAWTSTTAQLKNADFFLDKVILENTDTLRYNDEGTPSPMSMRTELIKHSNGSTTPTVVWRTHERAANGGSRTVEAFQGDASAFVESATATSLSDLGAFAGDFSGGFVSIIDGTGAGQIRPILSNTTDTLTLDALDAWTAPPDATSEYVAVRAGNDIVVTSRDRAFWLEESTTALGFALLQRAENILDIRRGARLMGSTHNLLAADNQAFNGIGVDLGLGAGNTGYWSSGFSRIRQGVTPTDPRLPLDGTQTNELVVADGAVDSATSNTLTAASAFIGENFSPPGFNFRLNNPSLQGSEYIVTITGGDSHRQTRRIASNTANMLTLEEDWGVIPSPGDLFEIYEIVAMPEAINPSQGYSANWNNKAATADIGRTFGRQDRTIFILERLAADSTWTRSEQRQLNEDVSGLDPKGKVGRYLIPRIRQAVDGIGNGGNPGVDTALAALEAHSGSPLFGRGFIDPVTATTIAGEVAFLEALISELSTAIYGDEFAGTGIGPPGGTNGLSIVQHAIDSAAAGPAGAYTQAYTGDYFNGVDWRIVVRDAFSATVTNLGGIPADAARPDSTYVHPLSPFFPNLVFDPTPIGNRGHYEQIIEVGPTVLGEFIFPLGQSAFIASNGLPDPNVDSLHQVWRDWRFVPMLHIAEDLAIDPDGDVDNDGVLDGFERWYFGSNAPLPTDDADADGLDLLTEFLATSDPTDTDTDDDALADGLDNCPAAYNPGQEDFDSDGAGDLCDRDVDGDGCADARELTTDETIGGKRDPLNPHDFYDVGDPNGYASTTGAKDGIVDLFNDIVLTIQAFSSYNVSADRGPSAGPNPWNMTAPDGVVDLFNDIVGVIQQFGHDCR